jgi:hypothetical protein
MPTNHVTLNAFDQDVSSAASRRWYSVAALPAKVKFAWSVAFQVGYKPPIDHRQWVFV